MKPRTTPFEPLWTRAFVLCFAANFLHSVALALFYHFPGYLQALGADELRIGLVFSLMPAAAVAARPWVGRVMDRSGRRRVILVGGALHLVACTLYLGITTLGPWVWFVRGVHGLADAMIFSGFFTYAADLVPAARRNEGIALFGLSGMLPMSVGGLLGDGILAVRGYGELFATAAVLAGLGWLLSIALSERRPLTDGAPVARGFRAVALQPDLLPVWFLGVAFTTALASPFTFGKLFVEQRQVGSLGLFLSAYSISAVVLRLFLARLPDRVGPKPVLIPALGVLAGGLLLLAGADRAFDVGLAGALCGIGHGFTFPILSALVVTRARESERGTAMAMFTAIFDAGFLFGGPAFGWVAQRAGYGEMFVIASVLVLVGAAVFWAWDRDPAVAEQEAA